ncbi:phage adaptor protein [Lysobacter sp. CA199]|uniref:phage adaptor protein n=1 Tax=Lysobacter sp. CA199 TaxID=3455608 RepID=UPI003F8D3BB4
MTLAAMRKRLLRRLGYSAQANNPPPGMADLLDDFIREAQTLLFQRPTGEFNLERFFTWDLQEGVRFYDLNANGDTCPKILAPYKVTWVGISNGCDDWRRLRAGINPELYGASYAGPPERYEIRQCVEVWPVPADSDWKLRIKGHFAPLPLEADEDMTSIDPEAIFMLALANAKAHYKHADAGNYMSQLRTYLMDRIAGSHHTRRYRPGEPDFIEDDRPIVVAPGRARQ